MSEKRITGLFLYWKDLDSVPESEITGVDRKILAQVGALRRSGIDVRLFYFNRTESAFGKLVSSLPFFPDGHSWPDVAHASNFDFVYLRRPRFISADLRRFFGKAKAVGMKTILDIPTYPYDYEHKTILKWPSLVKDRYNRRRLTGLVDRIVTPAIVGDIFGVSAITVPNGIELNILPRNNSGVEPQGIISIVCVAAFNAWHGIDRFIAGMEKYYSNGGTRELVLHLVGDGPVLSKLTAQVEQAGLGRHVRFYGRLGRQGMDDIYDRCSLGVECLGMHRRDPAMLSSSLKSREYLAKGVPFIYSAPVDVLEEHPVDFCFRVPADDNAIDIQSVIDFHDQLYAGEGEGHLISRIRMYAEKYMSWDATMRPVIDYIKQNSES